MFDFVEGAEIRMLKEALETHIKFIDKKLHDRRCDPSYWVSEKEIYNLLYEKICDVINNQYED